MSRDQFNQYDAERLPLNNPSHGHFLDPRNHKTPEFLSEFRGFGLYQYGGEGGIRTYPPADFGTLTPVFAGTSRPVRARICSQSVPKALHGTGMDSPVLCHFFGFRFSHRKKVISVIEFE
ncbi:hypothetical protein [Pseudomonas syringae]|uniref:hypothetical protein n=1 Tax=Pseudomonas syringae TaxID=317 RepID=UPI0012AD296F|nr:hypothetical protein [Pseudomonas syringae]